MGLFRLPIPPSVQENDNPSYGNGAHDSNRGPNNYQHQGVSCQIKYFSYILFIKQFYKPVEVGVAGGG
jgi:hypothetical protein